jgi:hypothetical protein
VDRLVQKALLVGLAHRLHENGSWSGEIHIQEAVYLLQDLAKVPFGFDFILHQHAPFSFELGDELASMRDDQLVEYQPQPSPYPPRVIVTQRGRELEEQSRQTMQLHGPKLDWIGQHVGPKIELELERLATALWIARQNPQADDEWRAAELVKVRPHLHRDVALAAVHEIDELLEQANAAGG